MDLVWPNSDFLACFIDSYTETRLRLANSGIVVDYTKWKCSYCESINTTEINCRNCGAPESKGLRNFRGLPFKKTIFTCKEKI